MKILAWILLIIGILLILMAIIIFFKFGGREACENLKKTKRSQNNDKDKELADEMFYKRLYAINAENKTAFKPVQRLNNNKPLKKRRIEYNRTLAQDDTALLARAVELKDIDFDDIQHNQEQEHDVTEDLTYEISDDDTEPLVFTGDVTEAFQK